MYIDPEEFCVEYLQPLAPDNVGCEMPSESSMPFILVTRRSGGNDKISEYPTVEIESWCLGSRDAARRLSRQVDAMMLGLSNKVQVVLPSSGNVVARVEKCIKVRGPEWLDYEDENLRRYSAMYEIPSRNTSVPV